MTDTYQHNLNNPEESFATDVPERDSDKNWIPTVATINAAVDYANSGNATVSSYVFQFVGYNKLRRKIKLLASNSNTVPIPICFSKSDAQNYASGATGMAFLLGPGEELELEYRGAIYCCPTSSGSAVISFAATRYAE